MKRYLAHAVPLALILFTFAFIDRVGWVLVRVEDPPKETLIFYAVITATSIMGAYHLYKWSTHVRKDKKTSQSQTEDNEDD